MSVVVLLSAGGCFIGNLLDKKGEEGHGTEQSMGVSVLGANSHSVESLTLTVLGDADDGLDTPRDIAFHPDNPDELWVVNQGDESITILWDLEAGEESESKHAKDASGEHFLAAPSGIAFGENGDFATIHDLHEPTQNGATGADFMGPTLWTGDRASFDGGHASHLDMLHNSPNGKGIAWEKRNRYWVFDGYHEAITMYDFHDDHGLGGTDHSDGVVERYVEGEVSASGDWPAHLEIDRDTGLLYVVDPDHARIAVLDTATGSRDGNVGPNLDGTEQYGMADAEIETLIDTEAEGLGTPVGLALHDGMLFVSSVDPAAIHAFDLDGTLVDWLELDRDVNGIELDEDGNLYFADPEANEVVRVSTGS